MKIIFFSDHIYMTNWPASLENPNIVTNRRPTLHAKKLLVATSSRWFSHCQFYWYYSLDTRTSVRKAVWEKEKR